MQNKATEIEQSWPSDYSELTDAVDDMIAIQPTQPTSEDTKIWINSSNTQTTVQVPTYEELTELSSAINFLEQTLPTEETGQDLLDEETKNAGLTETALAVIGLLFDRIPQDESAVDIYHSLVLENERLLAIYEIWNSERSA